MVQLIIWEDLNAKTDGKSNGISAEFLKNERPAFPYLSTLVYYTGWYAG